MKAPYNISSAAVPIIVGLSSFLILTLSYRRIARWFRTPNWVEEDFRNYLEKNNQICKKCNSYNRNIIDNPYLKCWKCDESIGQIEDALAKEISQKPPMETERNDQEGGGINDQAPTPTTEEDTTSNVPAADTQLQHLDALGEADINGKAPPSGNTPSEMGEHLQHKLMKEELLESLSTVDPHYASINY